MKVYIVINVWLDTESLIWCYDKAIEKVFIDKKALENFLKDKHIDNYYIIEKNIENF